MLGHLFSLLPAGPLPFRLNLLAVVCGAVAVTLVYYTALRLTADRAASACAALVLPFALLVVAGGRSVLTQQSTRRSL